MPSPPGHFSIRRVNRFPAAQIEVADAEVGALGDLERVPQGWEEVGGDVVEDAGHNFSRNQTHTAGNTLKRMNTAIEAAQASCSMIPINRMPA